MAQHVQDAAVLERRLRPIYDSFEVGNNKKALHEAEKVLKKTPNLRCAKALKGLALFRMGRDDESHAIINQIVDEKPFDDATLQVLSFIYKEQEQFEKICMLYANAAEQDAGNEEILSQLFMAYVRVNDFQSQQKVAMQLYKLKPKNPYYCWAVMSCVLKALRGAESASPDKSKLLLELAQRMVEKLINDDKMDAEQEVQLYLSILQNQGKYKEAWDFLQGPLGTRLYPGAPDSLKIDLLKFLKRWSDLNLMLKNLLRDNQDRWDYYKDYVETVFELIKSKEEVIEAVDNTFEMCHDFLCELIESTNKRCRGPYLGRLQLHVIMSGNNLNANELLGDFFELLVDYFRTFGDKPSCAKDIILFLDHLEPGRRAGFASQLIQVCEISSTTLPQSKEQMQKHICSLQVSRICGAHALSAEHLAALYTALSLHYEHGMSAFGMDSLPTDFGPSDPYALLAVHVMYDLSVKSNSSDRLVEALCLLHYLLSNSPSNFHAKLLCLQIYHRLGCGWGAHKTYESLNLKFIQLDSMGYLHCAQLPTIGMPSVAKFVYETTLKFYTSSFKESNEYLSMCYKFGSFSKLQEFIDFRDQLYNSLHYAIVSVEALVLEISCLTGTLNQNLIAFRNLQIDCEWDRLQLNVMTDNRDLNVVMRWDPPKDYLNEAEMRKVSYDQDLDLLQIRTLQLRVIAACIEAITKETYVRKPDATPSTLDKCEILELVLKNWNEVLERVRQKNYQPIPNDLLVNLLPSRLHGLLRMPYDRIFGNLLRLFLAIEAGLDDASAETVAKELDHDLVQLSKAACAVIEEHNQSTDLLWDRRDVQQVIVSSIEILCLLVFVMSVAHEKYLQASTNNKVVKRKKKPNEVANQVERNATSEKQRSDIISLIVNRLKLELNTIDAAIDSWKVPCIPEDLTAILASLSLNPNVETLVKTTIVESHNLTVKELKHLIKEKLRMLNTLSK